MKRKIILPSILLAEMKEYFNKSELIYVKRILAFIMMVYISERKAIGSFIPISRDKKKEIVGASAHYKYWKVLIDLEVVEEEVFVNGAKYSYKRNLCKRYRLRPKYFKAPLVEEQVKNKVLKKRKIQKRLSALESWVLESLKEIKFYPPGIFKKLFLQLKFQRKIKDKFQLDIKRNSLIICKKHKKAVSIKFKYPYSQEEWNLFLNDFSNRILENNIEAFQKQNFYCNTSISNRRLNNTLSNMDKVLFPFLKVDKKPLVRIDLKNSQPTLLATSILENSKKKIKKDNILYNKYLNAYIKSHQIKKGGKNKEEYHTILCSFKKESKYFKKLASDGLLYEQIQTQLSMLDRDEAKSFFISTLFSKTKFGVSKKIEKFQEIFPMLTKMILGLKEYMILQFRDKRNKELSEFRSSKKKGLKTDREAGDDYLSIYLQRLESKIFIHSILKELVKEKLWAVTIHDCIVCKQEDFYKVWSIMSEILDDILGVNGYTLDHDHIEPPKPIFQSSTIYLQNKKAA